MLQQNDRPAQSDFYPSARMFVKGILSIKMVDLSSRRLRR
jgi:hypothetical protein